MKISIRDQNNFLNFKTGRFIRRESEATEPHQWGTLMSERRKLEMTSISVEGNPDFRN